MLRKVDSLRAAESLKSGFYGRKEFERFFVCLAMEMRTMETETGKSRTRQTPKTRQSVKN